VLFVTQRGDMADFVRLAAHAVHLVNEHAGVEVARVVPVSRIPKTTSGKLQRTALARSYEDGEFAAGLAAFDAAWDAAHGAGRAAAARSSAGSRRSWTTRYRPARGRGREPVRGGRELAHADPDPREIDALYPGQVD